MLCQAKLTCGVCAERAAVAAWTVICVSNGPIRRRVHSGAIEHRGRFRKDDHQEPERHRNNERNGGRVQRLILKPTRLPIPGSDQFAQMQAETANGPLNPLGHVKTNMRVGSAAEGQRLNKFLSHAGVAVGRRGADELILSGRVSVNDCNELELGYVLKSSDIVCFDGKPVKLPYTKVSEARVWLFHKTPDQIVTTARVTPSEEHKNKTPLMTVFDYIKKTFPMLPKLTAVGRLDVASEGLMLFSNNPRFCQMMELPKSGMERVYRVRVFGRLTEKGLERLEQGVKVGSEYYSPMKVAIEAKGTNSWLKIQIKEGRNREIRKALESVGLRVTRLIRVKYGPYELGNLPPGAMKEVPLDFNLKKKLEILTALPKSRPEKPTR